MAKKRRAFIAGNHKCWFSKKYKDKSVNEVIKIDPLYLKWCLSNLKHLEFSTSLKERIKSS